MIMYDNIQQPTLIIKTHVEYKDALKAPTSPNVIWVEMYSELYFLYIWQLATLTLHFHM